VTHKEIVQMMVQNGVPYEEAVKDAHDVLNAIKESDKVRPSLSIKDIFDLGNIATILQLKAMKLQVRHNEGSATAEMDKNTSVILMKLKKSIDCIRDTYEKEHRDGP